MIDLVYQLVITTISMVIGGIIVSKLLKREIKQGIYDEIPYLLDEVKAYAEEWLNGETGQKALFQIGGLVGGGIKAGVGLNKTGGKKGMQGFLIDLAREFFLGRRQEQQQQTTQPQNINRRGTL